MAAVLLAAGAGRRMGRPKALLTGDDGRSWASRAVDVARRGGCGPVVVVIGAAGEEVVAALDRDGLLDGGAAGAVRVVSAPDWAEGMGASLRAGLAALDRAEASVTAALVMLVDTPDVGPDVVARLCRDAGTARTVLARATFGAVPGHPVLLGRDHWPGVAASARGDRGARDYLSRRRVDLVECGDLATGQDVDTAPASEATPTAIHPEDH